MVAEIVEIVLMNMHAVVITMSSTLICIELLKIHLLLTESDIEISIAMFYFNNQVVLMINLPAPADSVFPIFKNVMALMTATTDLMNMEIVVI